MKESGLFEAVGLVDERFIEEAAEPTAPTGRFWQRKRVLRVAVLAAAALAVVGFTAAGRFYFAPGVGIVDGASAEAPRVWACYDEISLGEAKIDAVVLGESGAGYTLSVWVWRGEEIEQDSEQAKQGIPPEELDDFTLFVGGTEYTHTSASMATRGFSTYSFDAIPFTASPTLRDSDGNEVTVHLQSISESQYAYLQGLRLDEKMSLSVVPVSGSQNLFAGLLHDPISAEIAGLSDHSYAYGNFILTRENGETGYASGRFPISGVPSEMVDCIEVRNRDEDTGVAGISPYNIMVSHNFSVYNESLPHVTITVPERGEGYACDAVLFDAGGIVCRLVRVEFGESGLQFTVETENHTGSALMQSIRGDVVWAYSMGEFDYTYADDNSVHLDVWPRMVSYRKETGELTYSSGYRGDEIFTVTVKPGDELVVILDHLSYSYRPEGVGDLRCPQATLGTIQLQ